jgi:hypothetical protein
VIDHLNRLPGSFRSACKSVSVFVIHQLVGTWGVPFLAYSLGTSVFRLMEFLGRTQSMRSLHWILTETPYFPVQIALGLYFGWLIGRRFGHRSMKYVWIAPFLLLMYAVIWLPTVTPELTSVLLQVRGNQSAISHYFGWGCKLRERCFDQLFVTMPFYTALSYSIGAWFAENHQ